MPSDIPPLICHPQEPTPDGYMEYTIEGGGVPVTRGIAYCSRFDERLSEPEKLAAMRGELSESVSVSDAWQRENEALRGIRGYLLDDLQWYGQERDSLLEVAKKAEGLTAELSESRETNRRLNRRCQAAESQFEASARQLMHHAQYVISAGQMMKQNLDMLRAHRRDAYRKLYEMGLPEWLLIGRLEKEREDHAKQTACCLKRRQSAEADFEAAKAHCLELEAFINRLVAEKNQKEDGRDADIG